MEQQFSWEKTEEGIRILRCYGKSGRVVIPAELKGQPVTELASYAFAGQMDREPQNTSGLPCICGALLEELYLPASIRRMGRYVFYNCQSFRRFSFYGSIAFMGAGLFTGCESLSRLILQDIPEAKSCLPEILSDLKHSVSVEGYKGEKLQYRLEYPQFHEEAVENTPARIIGTHTYGMGIQYRNAFQDTRVQFAEYDKLFGVGKYNMELTEAVKIAAYRLHYPCGLTEQARKEYGSFLQEHLEKLGSVFLREEDTEELRWLAEEWITAPQQAELLIRKAGEEQAKQALSMLMDIRHRRFAERKRNFLL